MFRNISHTNSSFYFGRFSISSFNFFLLVSSVVILGHAIMVLFEPYRDYEAFIAYCSTILVFCIAIILYVRGHFRTAKLLPIVAFNGLVFYLCFHLGIRSGALLYYFPYIVSFLYIFRNEQRDYRTVLYFIFSVINLITILAVSPVHSDHFRLPDELLDLVQHRAILISFLLTTFFVFVIYSFQGQLLQQVHENEEIKRKAILRSIIETQESERAAIVSALRDSINQTLNASRLNLENFSGDGKGLAMATVIKTSTQKAIEELDAICLELLPSSLLDISFEDGLQEYLENFSLQNNKTVWIESIDPEVEHLSNKHKLGVFRIIQDYLLLHKDNNATNDIAISIDYKKDILKINLAQNDTHYDFLKLMEVPAWIDLNSRIEYHNGILRSLELGGLVRTIIELPMFHLGTEM